MEESWLKHGVKFKYPTRKLAFFKALIYGERGRSVGLVGVGVDFNGNGRDKGATALNSVVEV